MSSPFWNWNWNWSWRKQKFILYVQRMFLFAGYRGTAPINTMAEATSLKEVAHHGSDNLGSGDDLETPYKHSQLREAFDIFCFTDCQSMNNDTYASLLQWCLDRKALPEGKLLHAHIIQTGFKPDVFLATKLVIMYAKCGSLIDARRVLDQMSERNVVSWTAIIAAYAKHGYGDEALKLFSQMQRAGIQPNQFTFAGVLPACASLAALKLGKEIHGLIVKGGIQSTAFAGSALIHMYSKCGTMDDAHQVFDKMADRNVVSWNAMIAGYARSGRLGEAMKRFGEMQLAGVNPNSVTFASVLSECGELVDLQLGKEIHAEVIRNGFESNVFVTSALVDMYAKCWDINGACQVFDKMAERNVISWTAMITGYAHNGYVEEAMKLFQKMPELNVVSWNAVIAGCAHNGYFESSLTLFREMLLIGLKPNATTFASVIPACAGLATLKHGKEIHEDTIRSGFQFTVFVGSALVDMYAKCGSIDNARKVFDKMPQHDVVLWSVLITGYAQNGHFSEALKIFGKMLLTTVKPNSVTFASVLSACAHLAVLEHGKEVHEDIIRNGFQYNTSVGNALVDMYAKCGSIEDASKVFNKMHIKDVVSWTAMIVGCAMHGLDMEALQLFQQMQHMGMKPNNVTFIGVLSACCHAGLVDDGWQYFNCMCQNYHIMPSVEHYCCMVDLLGRAGLLYEAQNFINQMPVKPDATVWGSLLAACKIYANAELGEQVGEQLLESNPKDSTHYVLLSNVYAAAGRWDSVERVRKIMKDGRLKKTPGCSWIEVNRKVYTFLGGDR